MDLALPENMMGAGIESSMVQGVPRAKKYAIYFL